MSGGLHTLLVFNPQGSALALLERTLTPKRRQVALALLDQVEATRTSKGQRHNLVVGPRGSGKTHLLAYVRKVLEQRETGAERVRVLALSEEERSIGGFLDFLLACLRAAIRPAPAVTAVLADLRRHPREELEERARERLLTELGGQTTILTVENLAEVFGGLGDDLKKLRAFLQGTPHLSLLASSCGLYQDSSRPDHPFYGFFNVHALQPLDLDETGAFLSTLAGVRKEAALAEAILAPENDARLRVMHRLTGGSHRLLAILAGLLTVEGLCDLVEPFVRMVDRELTPYYQQRLGRLSPQQHKVLEAVAGFDGRAVFVAELADNTFLSPQAVTRHLHDLLHAGLVDRHQVGRESAYELAEPLMRWVLDMKRGGEGTFDWIVRLLRAWYETPELTRLAAGAPEMVRDLYRKAAVMEPTPLETEAEGPLDSANRGSAPTEAEGSAEAAEARRAFDEGNRLLEEGRPDEAIAAWEKILARLSERAEPAVVELAARALVNKGGVLGRLGRRQEAIVVCDETIALFGERTEAPLVEAVAKALVNKGATLGALQRHEEAMAACDEVIARLDARTEALLAESVAKALVNKGIALGEQRCQDEAIATYEEVVARFGDRTERSLGESIAKALVNKGVALNDLERQEEAISACDEVVARFGEQTDASLAEQVARALVNKGIMLNKLGRMDEAIAALDDVVARIGERAEGPLAEHVAKALVNKGVALNELERREEAMAAYDVVVARFGERTDELLAEQVAMALVNKGGTLATLGRHEEAIAACDDVSARFGERTEASPLAAQVGIAAFNKGVCLYKLGRLDDAVDAFLHAPSGSYVERRVAATVHILVDLGRQDQMRQVCTKISSERGVVAEGLLQWLKGMLPLTGKRLEKVEWVVQALRRDFVSEPDVLRVAEIVDAVRRDALGDRKALLMVPLEIRSLILQQRERTGGAAE